MDKYCKNCGTELTPQQVFCSKCGVKLIIDDSPTNLKTSHETNAAFNMQSKLLPGNLDFAKIKSSMNKKEIIDGALAGGISFTLLVIFSAIIGLLFSTYINNELNALNHGLSFLSFKELAIKLSGFDFMNFSLLNTYILKMSADGDMTKIILSIRLLVFFLLPIASVYLSLYLLKKFKHKEKVTYNYLISLTCIFSILNLLVLLLTGKKLDLFFSSISMHFSYLYGVFIIPILIMLIAYISCKIIYRGQLTLHYITFASNLLPLYKKILALSIILTIPLLVSTLRSTFDLSFNSYIAVVFFMGLNVVAYIFLSLFGVPITLSTDVDSSSRLLGFFVDGQFSFVSALLYIVVIVGMVCLLYTHFNKILKKDRANYFRKLGKTILILSLLNVVIAYTSRIKISMNFPYEDPANFTIGVSLLTAFIMTFIVCTIIGIVLKYAENYLDKYVSMLGEHKRKVQLIYILVLLIIAFTNMLFVPPSQSAKAYKPSNKNITGYEKNKEESQVVYNDIKGNQHFIINKNEFLIQDDDALYTVNMKNHRIKKLISFDNYVDNVYVIRDKILVENNGRLDIYSLKGKKLNKDSIKVGNYYMTTVDNKYIYSYSEEKLYTMEGEAKYRLEEDRYDDLLPYKNTTLIVVKDNTVLKYDLKTKEEEELSSRYAGTLFRSQNDVYYLATKDDGNLAFVSVETGESLSFYDQPIIGDDRSWYININGKVGDALYKRDEDGNYNMVLDFIEYISIDSYNGKTGEMLIRMNNVPYLLDVDKVILHDIELEMWEGTANE